MATNTTGAEFKRFYNDDFYWKVSGDGDTWHEDEYVLANGAEIDGEYTDVADDAKVSIAGGVVFGPVIGSEEPSFEAYFKRWRKAQSTVMLMVEVDRSKEESMRAAIKAEGGKVVK